MQCSAENVCSAVGGDDASTLPQTRHATVAVVVVPSGPVGRRSTLWTSTLLTPRHHSGTRAPALQARVRAGRGGAISHGAGSDASGVGPRQRCSHHALHGPAAEPGGGGRQQRGASGRRHPDAAPRLARLAVRTPLAAPCCASTSLAPRWLAAAASRACGHRPRALPSRARACARPTAVRSSRGTATRPLPAPHVAYGLWLVARGAHFVVAPTLLLDRPQSCRARSVHAGSRARSPSPQRRSAARRAAPGGSRPALTRVVPLPPLRRVRSAGTSGGTTGTTCG